MTRSGPLQQRRSRRRIAAYAGGGVGALLGGSVAAAYGVLIGESKLARRRIPQAVDDPPVSHDTTWAAVGVSMARPPIRLAMLGDSTAAGYGVYRDRDTPAAQIAIAISEVARRPVHVTNVAVVGAQSSGLGPQVEALGGCRPEISVIMVGANDVTARIKPSVAVAHLEETVQRLRALGSQVVVGTCPDLGTIRPIAQPLRAYARHLSRTMARDQTVAVVRTGGRTVSLGDLIGPQFATRLELFSDDRFHPSAAGYAEAARAVLPSCLDALGLRTKARSASPFTTRFSKTVERAAAQAAARPGSEVAASEFPPVTTLRPDGGDRTWARLRRRRAGEPIAVQIERASAIEQATNDATST